MRLRSMMASDVPAALELSIAAGWNQNAQDWRMLTELEPQGCFGIEVDGQLVSATTIVCYGKRLAWIGMVLTKPEYRGRGFARALVTHAIQYSDSLGIETIKLDATDQGQQLYASLGFHPEQSVERWTRPGRFEQSLTQNGLQLTERLFLLDAEAFGADRSMMLKKLAARSFFYSGATSYALARTGRTTAYFGPCVASDAAEARRAITQCLNASPEGTWSWDLLPENREAAALASSLGFTRQRVLTRMIRGKPVSTRNDMVYAIAGFELG